MNVHNYDGNKRILWISPETFVHVFPFFKKFIIDLTINVNIMVILFDSLKLKGFKILVNTLIRTLILKLC